ncbi:MAG: hypothetical protein ACE5FY_08200 [Nitrospiria bacterium]
MRVKNHHQTKRQSDRPFRNRTFERLDSLTPKRSRRDRYLTWRISARSYVLRFGLKFREADRISYFIYLVNGEEDRSFLRMMETWVREVALPNGTAREVIDAIDILTVCRIDHEKIRTCRTVRREIMRYVRSRYQNTEASRLIEKTSAKARAVQ